MHRFPAGLRPSTPRRAIAAVLVTLTAAGLAAGCAPEAEPEPDPTGFASEEEALEAARATYEGYIEATNQVDTSDLESAEDVYKWLTGDALSDARTTYSEAHADATSRTGDSVVTLVEINEVDLERSEVSADACLDVSDVDVLDVDGESIVTDDRAPVQAIRVELVASDTTSTRLAISYTTGRDEGPKCDP